MRRFAQVGILIAACLPSAALAEPPEEAVRTLRQYLTALRSVDEAAIARTSVVSDAPLLVGYEILRWKTVERSADAETAFATAREIVEREDSKECSDSKRAASEAYQRSVAASENWGADRDAKITVARQAERAANEAVTRDCPRSGPLADGADRLKYESAGRHLVSEARLSMGRKPGKSPRCETIDAIADLRIQSKGGFTLIKKHVVRLARWADATATGRWVVSELIELGE